MKKYNVNTGLTIGEYNYKKNKCTVCGSTRHNSDEFWDLEVYKSKIPPNYKNSGERGRIKKMTCTYCNKIVHQESRCWKKKKDKENSDPESGTFNSDSGTENYTLMTCECDNSMKDEWIGDSGSTHHVTNYPT